MRRGSPYKYAKHGGQTDRKSLAPANALTAYNLETLTFRLLLCEEKEEWLYCRWCSTSGFLLHVEKALLTHLLSHTSGPHFSGYTGVQEWEGNDIKRNS